MESVRVERLDHLGVMPTVMKTSAVDMLDARLLPIVKRRSRRAKPWPGMLLNEAEGLPIAP